MILGRIEKFPPERIDFYSVELRLTLNIGSIGCGNINESNYIVTK